MVDMRVSRFSDSWQSAEGWDRLYPSREVVLGVRVPRRQAVDPVELARATSIGRGVPSKQASTSAA